MKEHKIPAEICIQRISDLFNINWGGIKPSHVTCAILDFNSALNTICRMEGLETYGVSKFLSEVTNIIRDFISENLDKKIYILYNTKDSKTYLKEHLGDAYLDFFYDKRPKLSDDIIMMYIKKLEDIAKTTNIKLINCGKFEPSLAAFVLTTFYKDTLIFSRSLVMLQLTGYGGTMWDGTFVYRKDVDPIFNVSAKRRNAKYRFPTTIPYGLYPYYICMHGIPLHGWNGLKGYGEKRSREYIENNITNLLAGKDEVFNYDDFKYLYPSEFIAKVINKDENLKKEFAEFRLKLFS